MGAKAPTVEKVTNLLQNLKVDSQSSMRDALEVPSNLITSNSGLESSVAGVADASNFPYEAGIEAGMYYTINGFATPHAYYYGGYEYPMGDWDDYSRHTGADTGEAQNLGAYSENGPVLYHPAGYAYGPQHVYGPYTSGAPISAGRADGQLYSNQGYSYGGGHVYQQSVPSNPSFIQSSAHSGLEAPITSAGELSSHRTSADGNNGPSGARPGHTLPHRSGRYGEGILPDSIPASRSQDVRVGYEGARAGAPWSELSKVSDIQQRHGLPSPMAPLGQQHQPYGGAAAAASGTLRRAFQPSAPMYSGSVNPGRLTQGFGATGWEPRGYGQPWNTIDKGKPWGRGNGMISRNGSSSSLDIVNEQNRGPRTTRSRYQRMAPGAVQRYIRGQGDASAMPEHASNLVNKEQFNQPDFVTKYGSANFFVIKSYSEDDIHKSIKYSVWASTTNGNKKLDAAYQEAQASSGFCPLFLFFSVNASGQFCGIAEMVGPVDFDKTLDFWQQDKWTGKFPVKWHVIKDVPNSQLRHIVLENNDNKPVTNSRDTQEVRLDQGLEMLHIFKNFNLKTSILDDFQFYETRQKFIQDKRARQQVHLHYHQQITHPADKDVRQKPSETVRSILQDDGRFIEAVEQSEKWKPKDGLINSHASENCNGSSLEDVQIVRTLSRSDSQDSSKVGVMDCAISFKDVTSGSSGKQ